MSTQSLGQPLIVTVTGFIEAFRKGKGEERDLSEFTGILEEIAARLPDCRIACSSDSELGISVDQPTRVERVLPIGRLISAVIAPDRIVVIPKAADATGLPAEVQGIINGDARIRGLFLGDVWNRSNAFLLFPRTDMDLLAFVCRQNELAEESGQPTKPIVLVHWDQNLSTSITYSLYHGHGMAPYWFLQVRTDRPDVGERVVKFLKNPMAFFEPVAKA